MFGWFVSGLAVWGVINLGFIPWLHTEKSGWQVTKRYPFSLHMQLMIPFYSKWEARVSSEDHGSVRQYRRRAQIWYYFFFLMPLAIFWTWLCVWVLSV